METKKQKNEELKSRREFFKEAAKKALPVLGAIALAGSPIIAQAAKKQVVTIHAVIHAKGDALVAARLRVQRMDADIRVLAVVEDIVIMFVGIHAIMTVQEQAKVDCKP